MLKLKRAYEPAEESDGYRVLVERLWPRGLKKQTAKLDAWPKELAPSDALRRWYGHAAERWSEFGRRYRRELESEAARALLAELAARAKRSAVTLVFATHDADLSNARILAREIGRLGRQPAKARARTRRAPTERQARTRRRPARDR